MPKKQPDGYSYRYTGDGERVIPALAAIVAKGDVVVFPTPIDEAEFEPVEGGPTKSAAATSGGEE